MPVKSKVQLITYVDRLSGGDLSDLGELLNGSLKDLFGGIHLLPFYEKIDGEDAGFDPIDHCQVDKRLGDWAGIKKLSSNYNLMVDLIVNHISSDSAQFQDYLLNGKESKYSGMFLRYQDVFSGERDEDALKRLYRPRPGLPFTKIKIAEEEELLWTTFSSKQIDINVFHAESEKYINEILSRFKTSGVSTIRLDAVGYAVKDADSSCFMTQATFDYISEFSNRVKAGNMEVLVEVHTHYTRQVEIARHVDKVYDFALPPLVLHSIYAGSAVALKKWLQVSPRNCITVLDTHDGIGIIDVSSEGSVPGLLSDDEIDFLIEEIHRRSNDESRKSTGKAANNVDLYQINCTYYSALSKNDNDYLLARLVQFCCPGTPQIYYVGLLAGENDIQLLEQTKVGRDVNRHHYSLEEIEQEIQREVVKTLFALIRIRNDHPAFDGEFSLMKSNSDTLLVCWKKDVAELLVEINFTDKTFVMKSTIDGYSQKFTNWSDLNKYEMQNIVNMTA